MNNKRTVFIMGDSYSTFAGYIPSGYHAYYAEDRKEAPVVSRVEKTWWRILAAENDLDIVLNDSFSGSTICNTVRETLPLASSFINRMDKYVAEGFFDSNKIHTLLIFGGTNDSWIDAPIGKLTYSERTEDDLKCVLPAFCHLIDRAETVADNVLVIINSDLKAEITDGFAEACDKAGVRWVQLANIQKENGHPTELGMQQIAKQVAVYLSV